MPEKHQTLQTERRPIILGHYRNPLGTDNPVNPSLYAHLGLEKKPRFYGFQETLDVLAPDRTNGNGYLQCTNSGSLNLRTDVIFPEIPKELLRVST